MHFDAISLSDFNNTIKLPAVDRRRERNRWEEGGGINYEKKKLIYGIGIYHMKTKDDPLSGLPISLLKEGVK